MHELLPDCGDNDEEYNGWAKGRAKSCDLEMVMLCLTVCAEGNDDGIPARTGNAITTTTTRIIGQRTS